MIHALLLATPLLPQVLEVHPTNGPFFEIADAVAAAVDGDVIRVADGQYQAFVINGKSLSVVPASDTPDVVVQGAVRIGNIDAHQQVSLGGLVIAIPGTSRDTALSAVSCTGSVRVQDCRMMPSPGGYSLVAIDVADLGITDTALQSVTGAFANGSTAYLTRVQAVLSGVELEVGVRDRDGDPGLVLDDSTVIAMGCTIVGGPGWGCACVLSGFGSDCRCDPPCGSGGDGVRVVGGSTLEVLDSDIQGGLGGTDFGFCPFVSSGYSGRDIFTDSNSSTFNRPGAAPTFDCAPFARLGQPFNLSIDADAADFVMLGASSRPAFVDAPGAIGAFLLDTTPGVLRRINLGTGPQSTSLTIPAIPTLAGATWAFQPGLVRAGGLVLGPGRTVVFLP